MRANDVSDGIINSMRELPEHKGFLCSLQEKPSESEKHVTVMEPAGASQMKPHQLPIWAHQRPLRSW